MEGMIKELESSRVYTDERIINGILNRRDESLPYLARLTSSREHWLSQHLVQVPLCAIHLLAMMEDYTARIAINTALIEYHYYTEYWITEDAPGVLAYIGTSAIPTLIPLLNYEDADLFVRNSATRALVIIAKHNPQTKSKIVSEIKDVVQNEIDIDVRTMLVDNLLDLRDPHLFQYLENLLKTGFITTEFSDLDCLLGVYAGTLSSHLDIIDPLCIFSYKRGW